MLFLNNRSSESVFVSLLKTSFGYRRVQLINYLHLSWLEKFKVYRYRISPFVQKGLGEAFGSFSDFLRFISNLKNEPYKGFWWVKDFKGRDIGSINLKLVNKRREAYLGLFKVPAYPKGGTILMETLLFVGFELLEVQKLKLFVFKDNRRAYRLYKKFHFEEVKTFNLGGKEVIKMVLPREGYI